MAKCNLSIELDHPERIYRGGEKITGTVHVHADADVQCKGLDLSCGWQTHGRGNVAREHHETQTVFSGQWAAGQRESYRFEMITAEWPPSYHGHYINVDHSIDAVARIPWAFDPKATAAFVMRPTQAPSAGPGSSASGVGGCVGNVFAAFVIGMIVIGFSMAAIALMTNAIAGLIALCVIVPLVLLIASRTLLPRWLLGGVETELITPVVSPGQPVRARLAFEPRHNVRLNAITAELIGQEVCVSGSGTDRKTHSKKFFQDTHALMGAATLRSGERQEFALDFRLPDDVPYSFELSDNNLKWTIELRVDIPRWPDWTQSLPLTIYPDGRPRDESGSDAVESGAASAETPERQPTARLEEVENDESEITFDETARYLAESRNDPEQLEVLLDAVEGLTFDLTAVIERRLLYSGDEDPHVYRDGYAVWAQHEEPPLPLVLYIPHELGDEYEQAGGDPWAFRGTIVGWDHGHRRLQIKVLVG